MSERGKGDTSVHINRPPVADQTREATPPLPTSPITNDEHIHRSSTPTPQSTSSVVTDIDNDDANESVVVRHSTKAKHKVKAKVAKRHAKFRFNDGVQGINKPSIRRLARRGGVKRISGMIYDEARTMLKLFLAKVIQDSITYMEHARRRTVTAMDVVYALKRQGRTLYGFGK